MPPSRGPVRPERLDQRVAGDDLVEMDQEESQQCPRASRRRAQPVFPDLRASTGLEKSELHTSPFGCSGARPGTAPRRGRERLERFLRGPARRAGPCPATTLSAHARTNQRRRPARVDAACVHILRSSAVLAARSREASPPCSCQKSQKPPTQSEALMKALWILLTLLVGRRRRRRHRRSRERRRATEQVPQEPPFDVPGPEICTFSFSEHRELPAGTRVNST